MLIELALLVVSSFSSAHAKATVSAKNKAAELKYLKYMRCLSDEIARATGDDVPTKQIQERSKANCLKKLSWNAQALERELQRQAAYGPKKTGEHGGSPAVSQYYACMYSLSEQTSYDAIETKFEEFNKTCLEKYALTEAQVYGQDSSAKAATESSELRQPKAVSGQGTAPSAPAANEPPHRSGAAH